MQSKILELSDRFPTGEPTIQVVAGWNGRGQVFREKRAFDSAAGSPAYEYLQNITPEEGTTIVLVNAMGAYETYDDNRNGDGFNERPYMLGVKAKCGHPQCMQNGDKGWISDEETLVKHYKTFEQHGGIYKHHVNKDPKKSLGRIRLATWNPRMHRVELLLAIENKLDEELVRRIADGEYPAVSMGCHVRWDVCSICGHRAPTRKDYCEHALMKLRQVLPDGRKVCVLNPSPRFFDISIVYRPADPTGFMLKKVAEECFSLSSAELGDKVAAYELKLGAVKKLSDIQKLLTGRVIDVKPKAEIADLESFRPTATDVAVDMPIADPKTVEAMARYTIPQVVSTLAKAGAWLTTSELSRLLAEKTASASFSSDQLDRIVAFQPTMLELLGTYPSLGEKLGHLVEIDARHESAQLAYDIRGWLTKRAGVADYLRAQAYAPGRVPSMGYGPGYTYRASTPAKTDLFTMTDPNTGQQYQTTRGAAQAADEEDSKKQLFGAATLSGMYLLGLHGMAGKAPWWLKVPAAGIAGWHTQKALTKAFRPYRNPTYMTDQGVEMSGGTEFMKTNALKIPVTSALTKMAHDYVERDGVNETLEQRIIRQSPRSKFAGFLQRMPSMSAKLAYLTSGIEVESYDATESRDIDLPSLADRIGSLILG